MSILDVGQVDATDPTVVRFEPSSEEEIAFWKGRHAGETCAIVGNGESVNQVQLGRISCASFGLNRAWELRRWTYYCMGDEGQLRAYREKRGDISNLSPLFATNMGPAHATRFRGLKLLEKRDFSFDLTQGVYLNNTIVLFALQLAAWMGFARAYLVGIDCRGRHFYGGDELPPEKAANQREALAYAAGALRGKMEVWNLNMNTASWAFPRKRFEEVFR